MPLHPQVDRFLKVQRALGLKPTEQCTPEELREMARASRLVDKSAENAGQTEDCQIGGPGGSISIRIYWPNITLSDGAMVYFHGGGWVGGDLDTHDALCRAIAGAAGCTVIAVDYRLAPEHPYPAAADDAYSAFAWVCENAKELNVAANKIAVCGDSAGGNLAAAASLMARDRKHPLPSIQILIYPIVARDFATSSYEQYAEGYSLTAAAMKWFWQQYAPDESLSQQPYAAPLTADDLSDLPPALVITAEYDVLCDEGKQFAARLRRAGVATDYKCYEGMIHGFVSRLNLFDDAKAAVSQIAAALKRSFDS